MKLTITVFMMLVGSSNFMISNAEANPQAQCSPRGGFCHATQPCCSASDWCYLNSCRLRGTKLERKEHTKSLVEVVAALGQRPTEESSYCAL